MKIEFGCGSKALTKGWVGCDVRKFPSVKYVCPCWEIHTHVPAGSVEEIYSRHMFEHLTFKQGENTLKSWSKILKKGGKVGLELPDLHYHVGEYIEYFENRGSKKMPSFKHAIAGFYGWQRESEKSGDFTSDKTTWDIHKSGYDFVSLKSLVEKYGFKNFKRNNSKPWNLNVSFIL